MKRWEYKFVDSWGECTGERELNNVGLYGWELVTYDSLKNRFVFKRELELTESVAKVIPIRREPAGIHTATGAH